MIERDDFDSADVKKLARDGYYRAKLDDANRLLLRFARHRGERYALLLEVIEHHAYEKSRFLRGAQVDEAKLQPLQAAGAARGDAPALPYVNPANPRFNLLDKVLSFDEAQEALYRLPAAGDHRRLRGQRQDGAHPGEDEGRRRRRPVRDPLALPGAATPATCTTRTATQGERQNVDFLCLPRAARDRSGCRRAGRSRYRDFRGWVERQPKVARRGSRTRCTRRFKGVLTGLSVERRGSTREDYRGPGCAAPSTSARSAGWVYDLFERYLAWLQGVGAVRPASSSRSATSPRRPALRLRGGGRGPGSHQRAARADPAAAPPCGPVPAVRGLEPDRAPELLLLGAASRPCSSTPARPTPRGAIHVLRANYRNGWRRRRPGQPAAARQAASLRFGRPGEQLPGRHRLGAHPERWSSCRAT